MTQRVSFSFKALSSLILECKACPRLIRHCQKVAQIKRKAYEHETYWGKPVTGFGDPKARIVLIGLAPGAHGANRTGRVFTGDSSGLWLYRALFRAGLASQAESIGPEDGLKLMDTYVTCVAKCAPPDNKPSPEEIQNCSRFLLQEFDLLSQAQVFVALGKVAWDSLLRKHPDFSDLKPKPKFAHGAEIQGLNGATLLGSYHPSQQNTFTKRLTEPMLDEIFERARALAWDHRGVAFL